MKGMVTNCWQIERGMGAINDMSKIASLLFALGMVCFTAYFCYTVLLPAGFWGGADDKGWIDITPQVKQTIALEKEKEINEASQKTVQSKSRSSQAGQSDDQTNAAKQANQSNRAITSDGQVSVTNQAELIDSTTDGEEPKASSSPQININQATQSELETLPGIGPSKARAILDYRAIIGSFQTIEEIKQVKGIGEKTFEKLKPLIAVE